MDRITDEWKFALKQLLVVLSTLGVALADSYTPLGFAHGYLYVPIVIYACMLAKPGFSLAIVLLSVGFVWFGYWLSYTEATNVVDGYVTANRILSTVVIALAYLLMGYMLRIQHVSTARKLALQQSHYFKQLTDALPILVWTAKSNGKMSYAGEQLQIYTGSSEAEILRNPEAFIHPEDVNKVKTSWLAALKTPTPYQSEFRIRDNHGRYEWFLAQAKPSFDVTGQVVSWFGSLLNISAQRQLTEHAERISRQLQSTLDSITDPFLILTTDLTCVYSNARGGDLLGAKNYQHRPPQFSHQDTYEFDEDFIQKLKDAIQTQKPVSFITYLAPQEVWLNVHAYPSPQGLAVYLRDVTRERTMEQQLRQIQRMESVGHLTGGIAHDFNNLLTIVMGNADLLLEQLEEPGQRAAAELVVKAAERGAALTASLLAFSRRQALQPESTDIYELLVSLQPLLQSSLSSRNKLEIISNEPELPKVEVDPAQLESAILNIAVNAKLAMPDGGLFSIELQLTELDEHYCQVHTDVQPGPYLCLMLSDTGVGIPAEYLPHIFEPFFSKRENDQGTGLGLSMVFGFIKQSGGHITAYSEVGIGTSFRLYFPITESSSELSLQKASKDEKNHGTHPGAIRVLVVEDDPPVRKLATNYLESEGFEVYSVENADLALEKLQVLPTIDLLLTDISMPGELNGMELATTFKKQYPKSHVLYTSGFAENIALKDAATETRYPLLTKPYRRKDLIDSIFKLMIR